MLSDDVLARLGELNRARVALGPTGTTTPATEEDSPGSRPSGERAEDVSQLPHGTEAENAWGKHWLRERSIAEFWPHGNDTFVRQLAHLDRSPATTARRARDLRELIHALPADILYLDLETCGFAGSMVFLVGLIHQRDHQLVLTQLLARNYAEEKAMLQTLWTLVAENRVLATFNGKSFDWPMVHDRSTIHHLGRDMRAITGDRRGLRGMSQTDKTLQRDDPRPELIHCDLLHHARRRWKHKLPDCKLQTLERYICRRRRADDIPGREIPSAYHDFVRSNDAWLIRSVLHHNALDLLTLLQISVAIAS